MNNKELLTLSDVLDPAEAHKLESMMSHYVIAPEAFKAMQASMKKLVDEHNTLVLMHERATDTIELKNDECFHYGLVMKVLMDFMTQFIVSWHSEGQELTDEMAPMLIVLRGMEGFLGMLREVKDTNIGLSELYANWFSKFKRGEYK